MSDYWWAVALFTGIINAGYVYINQIYKMPGLLLMLYRGFLVALLMLPLVLVSEPIHNWQFYAFCTAQGLAIAFNDYRFFRASKAFGAEISGSIHPLSVSVMFVMWLLITPAQLLYFLGHPLYFAAVVACLCGIIYAVIKLRRAKASARAFKYLFPVLLTLALGDILNKKSMQYGADNLLSAIIYYSFITGIVCGTANLIVYLKNGQGLRPVFHKLNLKHGLVISLMVIVLMIFKNLSMYLTPNPAYVSAIILLYPVWIMSANNICLHFQAKRINYARVNIRLLAILLGSVIGLVMLNS